MPQPDWTLDFPGAITVCDREGIILSMNRKAEAVFAKEGGAALVGRSLLDCHPEPARTKVRSLLAGGSTNAYTIEKAGKKKLIYQCPWFRDGVASGLVELSLEIPSDMPHFVRQG